MLCVIVVREARHQRPGSKAEKAEDAELEPRRMRQPQAEVIADHDDDKCDEHADDESHRLTLSCLLNAAEGCPPLSGSRVRVPRHACLKGGKGTAIDPGVGGRMRLSPQAFPADARCHHPSLHLAPNGCRCSDSEVRKRTCDDAIRPSDRASLAKFSQLCGAFSCEFRHRPEAVRVSIEDSAAMDGTCSIRLACSCSEHDPKCVAVFRAGGEASHFGLATRAASKSLPGSWTTRVSPMACRAAVIWNVTVGTSSH